ncbi:hypothetical protein EL22_19370 [Halostagnicola sp. A56]|uniref:HalOD1 output domain-containing protein n=1 Tax=Halostagnicola sp. A56 TaxID=1495067 RepID=UPI00049FFE63|nr:HalOD1 output domain-containing protein [Halostagnicola sp. A56]KDE59631.1 hypothetical protein EL22_19370 [Halostagnicola sp. A56]
MSDSSETDSHRSDESITLRTDIQPDETTTDAIVRLLEKLPERVYDEVTPLYDHVDPEALEHLFADTTASVRQGTARVTFEDVQIAVRDGDRVEIRIADEIAPPTITDRDECETDPP